MINIFSHVYDISASVVSDVGKIRVNNEDNYFINGDFRKDNDRKNSMESVSITGKSCVFAVCDGMGGEEYGEIASLIAVENLLFPFEGHSKEDVRNNMVDINQQIDKKRRELKCKNMGSTIAALYINRNKAFICNVGDSRIYMHRKGVMTQLSQDHNEATDLAREGLLSATEARNGVGNHVLTQYLGVPTEEFVIEPYISREYKIQSGDVFLICSDGVTDMLTDYKLAEVIQKADDADTVAQNIVNEAVENGGRDNATALAIYIK